MTRLGSMAAVLVGVLALSSSAARAGQATCSNPGLPVGAAATSDLMPGRLTLSLTSSLLPGRSSEVLAEAQGDVRYDASFDLFETRLTAALALRSWLGVAVALPYRVVGVGVTYRDPATGEAIVPEPNTIHARDETLHGIGDPTLMVQLARELGAYRLHARLGTSLPLGATVEDPFVLGQIGQEHQHLQFGTGTLVPFVALEVQRRVRAVTLAAWGLVGASLYENDEGYLAGDRYSAGLTASSALGASAWTFSAAAEVHAETAERWRGVVHEDEGNTGRVDVLAGVAAAWRPATGFAITADLKAPVYSHVDGNQLDYDVVVGLGLVATFDLQARPTWSGLDHATIGEPGTAPPLEPVIGRVTVFDLYADWCPPCRELDDGLEALARRYPGKLAVRKLDVLDTETAGWQTYLAPGNFELPHIKVHGPDGALLFERSAAPADLLAAVEAVVGAR